MCAVFYIICPKCGHVWLLPKREQEKGFIKCPNCKHKRREEPNE